MLIIFAKRDVCFLISIRLPFYTGLHMRKSYLLIWACFSTCPQMDAGNTNDQSEKTQTFMESMTRMFPMTVIRLRDPATRMMSTISTVVYGLPEKWLGLSTLLTFVLWDEFRGSILFPLGFPSHRYFRPESYLYNT